MNLNLSDATELFVAIAQLNEVFIAECIRLRQKPGAKGAHHGFDIRRCEPGVLIDCYFEQEISDDVALCWWVEIRIAQERWRISSSLSQTERGEQHIVSELVEENGESLEHFFVALEKARRVTIDSVHAFEAEASGQRGKAPTD